MNNWSNVALKIIGFFFAIVVSSQVAVAQKHKLVLGEQPVFKVKKAKHPIKIDGKMNEADWKSAKARSFKNFYLVEKPTDKQQTKFRMLWDEDNLYVFFQCKDKYITAREKTRDGAPYFDDCAEIFIIPVPDSAKMHIGFELNLYKTANDFVYINDYYKGEGTAVKAFNPDYEVEVHVNGTINDNSDIDKGWTMELAIPRKVFQKIDQYFPMQEGSKWAFLAVRQDRNDIEGERRTTSTIFPIYDIEKNVHQPNRFGLMEFVK